ncbi:DUF4843 domain-containing protein [Sphingobacterium bovistauri]|uniref:DUF4843 domain-containing protein n=1 Tax=Sphingobacterium bovistauri TaxID=2781959 RepID=A0ABS7Z4G1_9SPHI|nr:DUF4843 domain-containing protein [Sphingobacterium bovistauri]MCA5003644.1 DUF4843 domain-containing protein [Sphingobacterium bovistauri]
MKKFLNLYILSIALFISCAKEEIKLFEIEKDGIQFEPISNQFNSSVDFSFQSIEELDEWGWPMKSYLGDSIQEYPTKLIVSILGREMDKDRNFKLIAKEGEGLSPELIEFKENYVFRASRRTDTIDVILKRPAQRGKFKVDVTFLNEDNSGDFSLGAEEKLNFTFNITDQYPKPSDWDGRKDWLGEYSEEKYAFIVTKLNIIYGYYVDWGAHNLFLRNALEEYNRINPGNPKNFTFPVNTKSIWVW